MVNSVLQGVFCSLRTLLFLFICLPVSALADSSTPSSTISSTMAGDTATEPAVFESTERVINVRQPVTDEQIQTRIHGILDSAGKYTDLSVDVRDGLVFLGGQVMEDSFVEWAADIAKNIEGVVAVINNISVTNVSVFDLAPVTSELTQVWYSALRVLPLILIGLVVLLLCFFSARPLTTLLMKPFTHEGQSSLVHTVMRRVITLFIILLGFYFFLRIAGLTQVAVAIISGTGVVGLVVGFAFKDIAENFIASLLLSVQHPFQMGDLIEIEGHTGVVQKMTARATTLVDLDGNHIQIPNATIYSNIIRNLTANPLLRVSFTLGIGYDSSIRQTQLLAMDILRSHEAVIQDPEPQVLVESLGSATINMRIYFWIDHNLHSASKVASMLMRLILRELERNGISLPGDSREIIFPHGVPVVITEGGSKVEDSDAPSAVKGPEAIIAEPSVLESDLNISEVEDISTDIDEIREQAAESRDPEQGQNIL